MNLDPHQDPRLDDAHQPLYGRVFPFLDEIASELGGHIERLTMNNLARRLVSRGYAPQGLADGVLEHALHQQDHNAARHGAATH